MRSIPIIPYTILIINLSLLHTTILNFKTLNDVRYHTLNDGQKYNDDKEKECDIEHNPVNFVFVAVGWSNFVSDTTTSSHAFVQMEHKTLKNAYNMN